MERRGGRERGFIEERKGRGRRKRREQRKEVVRGTRRKEAGSGEG